jgi:hypothetical protein
MRHVLIVGLYYPPANFSAARRLAGWARHLPSFGYEPLVITRYYDPEERNTGDFYASSRPTRTLNEPWIESDHVVHTKFVSSAWKELPLPGKIRGLGHFAWPDPDHSHWLKQCLSYFENSNFTPDLIIGSFSPAGVFRVTRKLAERFQVPWIADFRDLWLHHLDDGVSSRLKLSLQRRHLRSAAGVTVVTDGMVESIREQLAPLQKPVRAIYNGADPVDDVRPDPNDGAVVAEFEKLRTTHSLILSYTGTLYAEQLVERFFEPIREFNDSGRGSCAVVLCGRHDPDTYKRWPFVKLLGTVGHSTSLFFQKQSSALFYPTWPATDSVYSGKIFELLVSGRPLLVGFTPSADLESLCRQFPNVVLVNSFEELIASLAELQAHKGDAATSEPPVVATKKYWAGQLAAFFDEILADRSNQKALTAPAQDSA